MTYLDKRSPSLPLSLFSLMRPPLNTRLPFGGRDPFLFFLPHPRTTERTFFFLSFSFFSDQSVFRNAGNKRLKIGSEEKQRGFCFLKEGPKAPKISGLGGKSRKLLDTLLVLEKPLAVYRTFWVSGSPLGHKPEKWLWRWAHPSFPGERQVR